jgi:hypothetical protein
MAAKKETRVKRPDPKGDPADEGTDRPAPDTDEPAGKRLGIQLGPDGRIEWDRLRDRTREELRIMLSDPRIAAELGATGVSSAAPEMIDGATVGMLYGALGALMVGAAKAAGYPDDQALTLNFTAAEKAELLAPTAKVLSKYTGALGRWEDEIMLSFALGSVVFSKVSALKKPAQVIKMAERRPASDPVPDPSAM